jgi:hypothetical protein
MYYLNLIGDEGGEGRGGVVKLASKYMDHP